MGLSTYSDLQTAVASWLAKSSDSAITGKAPDFVTLAESRIKDDLKTLAMEQKNVAYTISSEFQALSGIDAQLVQVRRIVLFTASPYRTLIYLPPEQLISDYPENT